MLLAFDSDYTLVNCFDERTKVKVADKIKIFGEWEHCLSGMQNLVLMGCTVVASWLAQWPGRWALQTRHSKTWKTRLAIHDIPIYFQPSRLPLISTKLTSSHGHVSKLHLWPHWKLLLQASQRVTQSIVSPVSKAYTISLDQESIPQLDKEDHV